MRPTHLITARSVIPPELAALERLAYNLAWSWDEQAWCLFERLDAALWERSKHNPLALLRLVDRRWLEEAAAEPTFRDQLRGASERLLDLPLGDRPRTCSCLAELAIPHTHP